MGFGKITRKQLARVMKPSERSVATKSYVNRAIKRNMENKYYFGFLPIEFGSISSAWTEQNLFEPAQGTALNQRVGSEVKLTSLEIKGVIAQASFETLLDEPYNVMRVVIGLYSGQDQTPLTGNALIDTPITTQHFTEGKMIKKYFDKYVTLQITSTEKGGGDGYTPQLKNFNYFKRFKKPISFKFGSGGVNEINKILVMSCISDSGGVPNPAFINGYWKCSYLDA